MRKLMWFTIGFGASCAVGAYLLEGNVLALLGVIALALALAGWFCRKKWKSVRYPAMILFGCGVAFLWFWIYDGGYLSPAGELDGVTTKAAIEITDYCYETEYGVAADGSASWQGKTYRVRVYLDEPGALGPGDIVEGTFRFRVTTGGEEEATFHQGQGIFLLAYQTGGVKITRSSAPWWHYPAAHIRQTLLTFLEETFPPDTQSFARALLLGDDNDIDYETNTAFKVSGIRHIVAVSGLHVSILYAVICLFTGRRRVLTALVGIPVMVLFAAVAGFTPSVTRACIMNGLMMAALLLHREYGPPSALSFAALVMLAANPLTITAVGFQLSVGSMAGIFLFSGRIRNWLLDEKRLGHSQGRTLTHRLIQGFAVSVSVSLGAVAITTPLSALYFGTVSLISPLTNLLTLWMVTLAFYGIMAVCLVGLLWPAAGRILAEIVSWPIRYILGVSGLLAEFPLAAVYTESRYITVWLVFLYILLALFLLSKGKKSLAFGCAGVMGLCAALLLSWITPMTDECRVTVLNVGQGQSVILQSDGKTFLVDCGGDYDDDAADLAAQTLLSMGISRVDGMILTHYDRDHAGGAEYFLTRIDADALFLPGWEDETGTGEKLRACQGGSVYSVEEDMILTWEDSKLSVFAPEIQGTGNESSLCVLFQGGNCDILITGDRGTLGEKLLMERTDLPELEVLIAGHHGSGNSTSEELLALTKPKLAVISVGKDNRYGQPHQDLLDRLEAQGCQVLRTDKDGTIIIRR